jgi:hypothetical protein
MVYFFRDCDGYYTLLCSTVFEVSRKLPATLVLLLRGIAKGEPTARLTRELQLSRQTVHARRHQLLSNLNESAPTDTMEGQTFEVDENYQNAGGKKVTRIATRMTQLAAVPINNRDMAPMTTTARRSFMSSATKRAKSAVGWLRTAIQ